MWKVWEWGTAEQTQRLAVCLENWPDPRHTKEPLQRKLDKSWAPFLREREREGGGSSATEHVRLSSVLTVVDYHSKVFYIYFLKKSHDQGWIYLIKNTVKTVILWNIIVIYYCNQDFYIKKHYHLEVIGYVLSGFDPSHQNALFERCGGLQTQHCLLVSISLKTLRRIMPCLQRNPWRNEVNKGPSSYWRCLKLH